MRVCWHIYATCCHITVSIYDMYVSSVGRHLDGTLGDATICVGGNRLSSRWCDVGSGTTTHIRGNINLLRIMLLHVLLRWRRLM